MWDPMGIQLGMWLSSGAQAQTSGSCGVPECGPDLLTALPHSLTGVRELPPGTSSMGDGLMQMKMWTR